VVALAIVLLTSQGASSPFEANLVKGAGTFAALRSRGTPARASGSIVGSASGSLLSSGLDQVQFNYLVRLLREIFRQTYWAIASAEVAAGDGAFRKAIRLPRSLMQKSSRNRPLRSTAWARTPEGPGSRSWTPSFGTYRCAWRRNTFRLNDVAISWTPACQCLPAIRQHPGQESMDAISCALTFRRR